MGQLADARSSELIVVAVREAYASAGREPGDAASAVAPLYDLIRYQSLIVEEVSELTGRSAMAHLAARVGRSLVEPGSDDDRLSGFLYANASGGWILIHAGDPLVRRRFSIAHELGHYLLHFLPLRATEPADAIEFREKLAKAADADDGAASTGEAQYLGEGQGDRLTVVDLARMEEQADQFAAEVLMPAVVCRRLVEQHLSRCGGKLGVLARLLATELLVSHAAMERRLTYLKLE